MIQTGRSEATGVGPSPVGQAKAMIWIAVVLAIVLAGVWALLCWGSNWGSSPAEQARGMPGDGFFVGRSPVRVAMTRGISIDAPPESVWPWIAQLGRGAGWYSIDGLDNGRKVSARHVVSWIPAPRLGDATVIGYLRHLDKGRSLAWWIDRVKFLGSRSRLVTCYVLEAEGLGTRLISRMSADAVGRTAHLAILVFRILDSVMARRQLLGIRERVHYCAGDHSSFPDPETGASDQYQSYEVLFANGGSAGVIGVEDGARWRQQAIDDGVLQVEDSM